MSTDVMIADSAELDSLHEGEAVKQFVTLRVDGQLFGIPVLKVQDVLRPQRITRAPLAPSVILGSINLRGRIVTVIDVRTRLGLPRLSDEKHMQIVVNHQQEMYSFVVDSVGDVLNLPLKDFQNAPSNLEKEWSDVTLGVFRLEEELLMILNIEELLNIK